MKMKATFPNKLGWQFLLMILFTIVLPSMLFFLIGVNRYSKDLLQQTTEERAGVLQEINRLITFQMKDYQELSMSVYYNSTTKAFLDAPSHAETTREVDVVIRALPNTVPFIESIALCFEDGTHFYGKNFANMDQYRQAHEQQVLDAEGRCIWLPTECMVTGEGTRKPKTFTLARALNGSNGPVGTMYIFCSSIFFDEIMSNHILSEGGSHYYILAPNGQIVASDRYSLIGKVGQLGFSPEDCTGEAGFLNIRGADGRSQIATYSVIEKLGWISVIVSDTDCIYQSLHRLEKITMAFGGVYLLAMFLGYAMIYRLLLRPLSRLSNGMAHVAKGEFLELPSGKINNEVGQLTNSYNDMVIQIQGLMEKIREEEREKNRQRIKVLNMQIGPHFLYNTLNSIKWMAVLNNQTGIKTMVDALMKLVSGVTYNKEDNVTVRQELEFLDRYIYIQKVRFVNFSVRYEIPEDVMDLQIGRFVIQPFVENSIIHGFRGLSYEGVIEIRARRADMLYLEIRDNGRGFDPAATHPADPLQDGHDHVGIQNVKERIQLNYGEDYGVWIKSAPNQGTTVYLKLPILEEESL